MQSLGFVCLLACFIQSRGTSLAEVTVLLNLFLFTISPIKIKHNQVLLFTGNVFLGKADINFGCREREIYIREKGPGGKGLQLSPQSHNPDHGSLAPYHPYLSPVRMDPVPLPPKNLCLLCYCCTAVIIHFQIFLCGTKQISRKGTIIVTQ